MGVMIAMFSILALGGLGIYMGLKVLENFRPGRNKVQKDLQKIKAEMQPYLADLVPIGKEEMEQLSLKQVNRTSSKGISQIQRGIFTTVYHEPLIAWSYKKYVSGGENALLYARTADHEFVYRIKKEHVEIVADDLVLGMLDNEGRLFPKGQRKALAQLSQSSEELALPVLVNNREVGSLSNPRVSQSSSQRAFYGLSEMNKDESRIFLSLAILEMIRKSL